MPLHRETSDSVSVKDLLDGAASARPTRHRAESGATDRLRVVVGSVAAAGALFATGAQIAPAAANAAPLAPADYETEGQPSAPAAAVPAAPIAAPFGLTGLPPEIAGPLAQAEQVIQDLQQQGVLPSQPSVSEPAAPTAAAPVVAPIAGVISSEYGSRWGEFHYGVDIADQLGTPIQSVMGGTVVEAGPASGFGQWVRVLQDDGTTAVYGHINDIYVQEGQRVNAGEVIASVGNKGWSTGPHLHLEIWDAANNKIDPMSWLAGKGVVMEEHWGADL